jgi:hypothetical protein
MAAMPWSFTNFKQRCPPRFWRSTASSIGSPRSRYNQMEIRFGLGGPATPLGDNAYQIPGGVVSADRAFTLEGSIGAVPEPSTWAMVMLGFAGIGFMAYHRRTGSASVEAWIVSLFSVLQGDRLRAVFLFLINAQTLGGDGRGP